jgi:LPS-assembly protein
MVISLNLIYYNKISLIKRFFFTLPLIILLFSNKSFAISAFSQDKSDLPVVLKALTIEGDKLNQQLIAKGNVEVSKGLSVVYADQITYNKFTKSITVLGNLKIKNLEVGFIRGTNAEFADDFSWGNFYDSRLFFNDGSYLFSKKIIRENPLKTSLYNSFFSFCPNDDIVNDETKAGVIRDFAGISSSKTTIDRKKQIMTTSNAVFRILNIPIFYTPYLSTPLLAKKRESGLLQPSYVKNSNFGLGIKIPYYLVINPHIDLTISPLLYTRNNQFIIDNDLRHYTKFGRYNLSFEIANNRIKNNIDNVITSRTSSPYRWQIEGKGDFDIDENFGGDFSINTVSDRDYQRDYHFNYSAFSISKLNFDYIKGRDYFSVKSVRFQELEKENLEKSAQFILPAIDYYVESKPFFFKEKISLKSNAIALQRQDGLQYRRLSMIPQANIPFNVMGNLIDLSAKIQNDYYWLENNFSQTKNNNYEKTQSNYKTEFALNWKLPIIRKSKANTVMIEPMANLVSTGFKKDFHKLPNEDGNDGELTFSNLFITDRIAGYDRNEIGERFSFGARTSFFNKFGEFGLYSGQSYRISNTSQDVDIRGFANNNKSNIVGQASYKAKKYFSLLYLFQLNESNYNNEVNQVSSSFNYDLVTISANYLLLKKTTQNIDKKEQVSLNAGFNLNKEWKVKIFAMHDIELSRTLSRGISFYRDGCCTVFGFSISENNPSNLTKPQKTFNLNLSFKNL